MRMKLLIVTSALDLRLPYGGTCAWWNLFTALYEQGVDLLVTVYQGKTIPSPWWESFENPCYWEGYLFAALKNWRQRLLPTTESQRTIQDSLSNRVTLTMARVLVRQRWRNHLLNILRQNQNVDAVLFINLPLNQLRGIPTEIRERYDLPVICYDSDIPISLPGFQGFRSGFRIYYDTDLREYDLFLNPSIGGVTGLEKLGAKKSLLFLFGTNPTVFSPVSVPEEDIDVFFYGFGSDGRQDWMRWMLTEPSRQMLECRFAIRGQDFYIDLGNTELLTNIPFNRLREYCCRSKINVSIVRNGHASVYGSSTTRPFEMAAMECCMVCNPYPGLEEWFEPGKEVFVVNEPGEVVELYRWLLTHETERKQVGKRARERVLKEHTYQHRAKQLVRMIQELVKV